MKERFTLKIPSFIKVIKHLLMSLAVALMPYKAAADINVLGKYVVPGSELHRGVVAIFVTQTDNNFISIRQSSGFLAGPDKIITAGHTLPLRNTAPVYIDKFGDKPILYYKNENLITARNSSNTITTTIDHNSSIIPVIATYVNDKYDLHQYEVSKNDNAALCVSNGSVPAFMNVLNVDTSYIPNGEGITVTGYGIRNGIVGEIMQTIATGISMTIVNGLYQAIKITDDGDSGSPALNGNGKVIATVSGSGSGLSFFAPIPQALVDLNCGEVINNQIPENQRTVVNTEFSVIDIPNNKDSKIVNVNHKVTYGRDLENLKSTYTFATDKPDCLEITPDRQTHRTPVTRPKNLGSASTKRQLITYESNSNVGSQTTFTVSIMGGTGCRGAKTSVYMVEQHGEVPDENLLHVKRDIRQLGDEPSVAVLGGSTMSTIFLPILIK